MALAILLVFPFSDSAMGWGALTGGRSHQYILDEAYQKLKSDPAFPGSNFPTIESIQANEGVEWVHGGLSGFIFGSAMTLQGPGPDSPGNSPDSAHYYNPRTGNGQAPVMAANLYEKLKGDILSKSAAGRNAAYMAHFIADISVPYHINGMPASQASSRIKSGNGKLDENIAGVGQGGRDWMPELSTWQEVYNNSRSADWFDPWYRDGSFDSEGKATSTHVVWETNYGPTWVTSAGVLTGYSKEFDQLNGGNGDKRNIEEFVKRISQTTNAIQEDTWGLFSNTQVSNSYDQAIANVYTAWRASFSALRPEVSVEKDAQTGASKIVVTIKNLAKDAATNVQVNLKISGGTLSGPDGTGLASSSYKVPDPIPPEGEVKIEDVWELEEPEPGDDPEAKSSTEIVSEVTGSYADTPDSGKAIAKKVILNQVANSIILLFDASGSMDENSKIDNAKAAAKNFLAGQIKADDEVALIVFYDCGNIVVEQPFTTDKSALTSKIDAISPSGGTPLYEAISFARDYMSQNARGQKKKILQFTDGEETCGGGP